MPMPMPMKSICWTVHLRVRHDANQTVAANPRPLGPGIKWSGGLQCGNPARDSFSRDPVSLVGLAARKLHHADSTT